MPNLVIGLGSAYGDDQLGWKVIDQLGDIRVPVAEINLLKAERGGVELLDRLESLSARQSWHIMVVDAVISGMPPGTLHGPETIRLDAVTPSLSSHAMGIAELLTLLSALGANIQTVTLFGAEADAATVNDRCYKFPLSRALELGFPRLITRIARHLQMS